MIYSMTPDIQQAVSLFFADQLYGQTASPVYRIGIDEIKREFRKKALQFHPDRAEYLGKNKGQMEEKFKQINHAYGVLKSALDDDYLILRPQTVFTGTAAARRRREPGPDFSRKQTYRTRNQHQNQNRTWRKKTAKRPGADKTRPDKSKPQDPYQKNRRKHYFFEGSIPKRELRLGEYLFYNRIIAWRTLISAIVWQHRMRPRLGQIAMDLNYMAPQDIMTILKNKKFKEPFGMAAVRLGLLDQYKRFVLLGRQRSFNFPLGRYFLDYNILTETSLEQHIRENRIHNLHYNKRFFA